MEDEAGDGLLLGLTDIIGDGGGIERRRVDVQPRARPNAFKSAIPAIPVTTVRKVTGVMTITSLMKKSPTRRSRGAGFD